MVMVLILSFFMISLCLLILSFGGYTKEERVATALFLILIPFSDQVTKSWFISLEALSRRLTGWMSLITGILMGAGIIFYIMSLSSTNLPRKYIEKGRIIRLIGLVLVSISAIVISFFNALY